MQALLIATLISLVILPSSLVAALILPLAARWAELTLFTLARAAVGLPPL